MRSMMSLGPPGSAVASHNRNASVGTVTANLTATASTGTITNGPWNRGIGVPADVSGTSGRTRSTTKGKGKSRR